MATTNQAWHETRRRQLAEERFGGVCECGNHAWARLTRGYVVLVDAGDAGILQTHPRNAKIRQCEVYASRGENTLHRELLGTDAPATDFKNRNTLDCRRDNLQKCTYSEVTQHRRRRRGGSSQFKGVHLRTVESPRNYRHWVAMIGSRGKYMHIESFPFTPEGEIAAAHAYDAKARELFGEHAAVNFPREGERPARRQAV